MMACVMRDALVLVLVLVGFFSADGVSIVCYGVMHKKK